MASTSYNVDTDWYTRISAMDHITFKLDKLTMCEKYGGSDQVHVPSGSCMATLANLLFIPKIMILLKNVFHVPNAFKNLLSVRKFTYDNNAFFEIHA
jgi:hypothetical protein